MMHCLANSSKRRGLKILSAIWRWFERPTAVLLHQSSPVFATSKTTRRRLNYSLSMVTQNHSRQAFSLRARMPYRNTARTGYASHAHTKTACQPGVSSAQSAGTNDQEPPSRAARTECIFSVFAPLVFASLVFAVARTEKQY